MTEGTVGFEFVPYPKIARLNRDIIITEKIDGTNAAVHVFAAAPSGTTLAEYQERAVAEGGFKRAPNGAIVAAQSRSRIVVPGKKDNFGFAGWVWDNAEELSVLLGNGIHFGEWWGAGVQRTYGLKTKAFSLFNVTRWRPEFHEARAVGGVPVGVVPTLYMGGWIHKADDGQEFGFAPEAALDALRDHGSLAAPGFMTPEGIVVFHEASGRLFKATIENDEKPKGAQP